MYDDRITIPTFIKLLAISIVPNRWFGFFNSFNINALLVWLLLLKSSFSDGVREKKATSDPDTKAEKISKIIVTIAAITLPDEKGRKCIFSKIVNTG